MDLAVVIAQEEAQLRSEMQTLEALLAPFWKRRQIVKVLREQIWHRRGAIQAARKILDDATPKMEQKLPAKAVKRVLDSVSKEIPAKVAT